METRKGDIIQDIQRWKEQNSRYGELFSSNAVGSTAHQVAQIRSLMAIVARYRTSDADLDEVALNLVKTEMRLLEKKAFPSVFRRLLFRIYNNFLQQRIGRNVMALQRSNVLKVQSALDNAGLRAVSRKIIDGMAKGLHAFSIPVVFQVKDDDRMNISVQVIRRSNGIYDLEYTSSLKLKGEVERAIHFNSDLVDTFNVGHAESLLRGNAVRMNNGEWMQLDFTDKDSKGNYLVKRYPEAYGYNPGSELEHLPFKDGLDMAMKDAILNRLEKGLSATVLLGKDDVEKVVTIMANPGNKNFHVQDLSGRKVELSNMFTKKVEQQHSLRYVRHKTSKKWVKQ